MYRSRVSITLTFNPLRKIRGDRKISRSLLRSWRNRLLGDFMIRGIFRLFSWNALLYSRIDLFPRPITIVGRTRSFDLVAGFFHGISSSLSPFLPRIPKDSLVEIMLDSFRYTESACCMLHFEFPQHSPRSLSILILISSTIIILIKIFRRHYGYSWINLTLNLSVVGALIQPFLIVSIIIYYRLIIEVILSNMFIRVKAHSDIHVLLRQ